MRLLIKNIRTLIWTVQSMFSRYVKQIGIAFVIGIVLFILVQAGLPNMHRFIAPATQTIGMVGAYEPSNLPIVIQQKLSKGLTAIADNGEAQPSLAGSWQSDKDGKRYFFYLSKNITWHNGDEFTAFDVNYRFKDVVITAADRYTLKIELTDPFAPLPTLLSRPLFKTGLIGVGEYKVKSLKLKEGTVEELVLQPSRVQNSTAAIHYRFYANQQDAITAFKLGEVDALEGFTTSDVFAHENNVRVEEHVLTDRFLGLFYNLSRDELKKREFRQSLNYGIPQLAGIMTYSPIAETSWAYNTKIRQYQYNKQQSLSLFKKAEVATASSVIITTFPEYLAIAEKIAASWTEIGIASGVKVVRSFPDDFDAFLGVQEIPPDPDQYPFWHSTQEQSNITHYNNPKVDRALEEGRRLQIKEERLKMYLDFQKYLLEDPPSAFLIHPVVYTIIRK